MKNGTLQQPKRNDVEIKRTKLIFARVYENGRGSSARTTTATTTTTTTTTMKKKLDTRVNTKEAFEKK
jgi:hypothetical protein